jgi:hypothetical protein
MTSRYVRSLRGVAPLWFGMTAETFGLDAFTRAAYASAA